MLFAPAAVRFHPPPTSRKADMEKPVTVNLYRDWFNITAHLRPRTNNPQYHENDKVVLQQFNLLGFNDACNRFYNAWQAVCGIAAFADVLHIYDYEGAWEKKDIPPFLEFQLEGDLFGVLALHDYSAPENIGPYPEIFLSSQTPHISNEVEYIWGMKRDIEGLVEEFHNFTTNTVVYPDGSSEMTMPGDPRRSLRS